MSARHTAPATDEAASRTRGSHSPGATGNHLPSWSWSVDARQALRVATPSTTFLLPGRKGCCVDHIAITRRRGGLSPRSRIVSASSIRAPRLSAARLPIFALVTAAVIAFRLAALSTGRKGAKLRAEVTNAAGGCSVIPLVQASPSIAACRRIISFALSNRGRRSSAAMSIVEAPEDGGMLAWHE